MQADVKLAAAGRYVERMDNVALDVVRRERILETGMHMCVVDLLFAAEKKQVLSPKGPLEPARRFRHKVHFA